MNLGPNLSRNIMVPNGNINVLDYLKGTNSSIMFLAGVEENEVTNIVKKFKK